MNGYDSESMAGDIADAIDESFSAEIGETFTRGDGFAFNVVTPGGKKFLVTVKEMHEEN